MEPEIINLYAKRLEQMVVSISTKVADTLASVTKSQELLIRASQELEELYISLGDPAQDDKN